jgi:hypothetical protein
MRIEENLTYRAAAVIAPPGRHVDVYRSPPANSSAAGQYLTGQRIYVIKPRP